MKREHWDTIQSISVLEVVTYTQEFLSLHFTVTLPNSWRRLQIFYDTHLKSLFENSIVSKLAYYTFKANILGFDGLKRNGFNLRGLRKA